MQNHSHTTKNAPKKRLTEPEYLRLCDAQESKQKFYNAMDGLKQSFSTNEISLILQEAYMTIESSKPEISDFDLQFWLDDRKHGWIYEILTKLGIGHQDPCSIIAVWTQVNAMLAVPAVFVDKATIDEILLHIASKYHI